LFVVLRAGVILDLPLQQRIREHIRRNTSPRHVPARIVQVDEVPRTRSGKVVELAVRDVVHGRQVVNLQAIANAQCLDQYRNRQELGS
jgi:acetoacetyl-CoA synthetase